jgi:hypothetical protein
LTAQDSHDEEPPGALERHGLLGAKLAGLSGAQHEALAVGLEAVVDLKADLARGLDA